MSLPSLGTAESVAPAPAPAGIPGVVCWSVESFSNELNSDRSEVELDIFRAISSSSV